MTLLSTTPAICRAANDELARSGAILRGGALSDPGRVIKRDARLWSDAAAQTGLSRGYTGSLGARNRRNRCITVIFHPGGDPIVVAQLDRITRWSGSVRRAGAWVRYCSTVGKCDDTKSAADGNRRTYRPQVRCVREPRALEV